MPLLAPSHVAGAAVSTVLTYNLEGVGALLVIVFSPKYRKVWTGLSRSAFRNLIGFSKLALPGAGMLCLSWCGLCVKLRR